MNHMALPNKKHNAFNRAVRSTMVEEPAECESCINDPAFDFESFVSSVAMMEDHTGSGHDCGYTRFVVDNCHYRWVTDERPHTINTRL